MADDGHSSSSSTSASAAPAINSSVAPGTGAESSDAATSAAAAPDAPAPAIVTVNIKTLNGPDFELAVARNVLVSELKTKVRERTDVEEARQRLIYRGKVLADTDTLSTYKVESGHYVHMVARPQGVPPPASATAGVGMGSPATSADPGAPPPHQTDAGGASNARPALRSGTLGERLLMGMGLPMFAAGDGGGAEGSVGGVGGVPGMHVAGAGSAGGGAGNGGVEADAALLNAAAGLDGRDILSNMLGLGDGAGGGLAAAAAAAAAAAGGGGGGGAGGGQTPHAARALWNTLEGRGGARGEGRERAAGAVGGASRVEPAVGAGAGERGAGQEERADLEHVRQGLLTLHTLLSGTTSRRRRPVRSGLPAQSWSSGENSSRSVEVSRTRASTEAAQGRAVTSPPPASAASKDDASEAAVAAEAGVAAPVVAAAWGGAGAGAGGAQEEAAPIAAVTVAKEDTEPEPRTEQQRRSKASKAAVAEEAGVAVPVVAVPVVVAAAAGEAGAEAGGAQEEAAPIAAVTVAKEDAEPEPEPRTVQQRRSEASPSEPSFSSSGSSPGRAWLPQASFDDESEDGDEAGEEAEGDGAHRAEWLSSSSGSAPSRHWPFFDQDADGSPLGSALSEGPPRLLSSSAESNSSSDGTPDRWDDALEARSPGGCRRPVGSSSRHADPEDDEEKEDGLGCAGSRSRPMTRKFFVGQWLDVKDTVNNWLEATVMDMTDSGTRLQIHYNGWPPRWDEWLTWDSPRIAPFRTRTQHLPHSQHVSPAPVSAVRNAPITGMDDVRVMMPEVSRVLQEIAPMVDELSACYARNLEQDPSTSPSGERAVSHTLPWTRQRIQQRRRQQEGADSDGGGAAAAAARDGISPKAAHLAGDIAPLFDRLGRMLTDVAPHLARLSISAEDTEPAADAVSDSAAERDDAAEPGELPWGSLRHQARGNRGGAQRSQGSGRGGGGGAGNNSSNRPGAIAPDDAATAFRQLVSTSSPAPTSSNINIHIHAIVPLRAPPSPPPPPPPTASASAVATPTRADRPPLSGSRNPPWSGNMDTVGGSASLIAAARAAAASRAATSARDADTATEGGTPRRLSRGILAEFARSGSERETAAVAGAGGAAGGGGVGAGDDGAAGSSNPSRSASVASSVSFDVTGVSASPLTVTTPGSSVAGLSDALPTRPSSGNAGAGGTTSESDSGTASGADLADADASSSSSAGQNGGGQRRSGGWRGLLRALGVGGNGSSRVSGRRDGTESEQTP